MEIEQGSCIPLPHDLKNSQFRWQNEGEVSVTLKKSSSTSVVTISVEAGYVDYEIDSNFEQRVGTKVTVLYDKVRGKYFIGNAKLSNDDIIKEYFEYLACSKFFYYNLVGILAIMAYLGFPFLFSFYATLDSFWDVLILILVIIAVLLISLFLSVVICLKFGKLMYYRSKEMYEDDEDED